MALPPTLYPCEPLPAIRTNGPTVPTQTPHHLPQRKLTVQQLNSATYTTPRIRLVGRWLSHAGFNPRDQVTVTVTPNKLVIVRTPRDP